MRYLTTITGKTKAESFVSYLLTKDIATYVESTSDQNEWEVWIRDEDELDLAKREYSLFVAAPDDAKYRLAVDQAKGIVKEKKQKSAERQKNIQYATTRVNPNLFGGSLPPLTLTLILLCVFFGLVQFADPGPKNWLSNFAMKQLRFVDMDLYAKSRDAAVSLKQGELWRVLTPAFLHAGPFHLLFNMLSLASLGRLTERLEGIGRYALILLIVAIGSHLLQGLVPIKWFGSPNFVGISGVIFGLLGYMGTKTTLRPDLGFQLPGQVYLMTGLILVLGFAGSGATGFQLANLAHLGGLVTGIVVGLVMSDRRFDRRG
jgi:GlpG protein